MEGVSGGFPMAVIQTCVYDERDGFVRFPGMLADTVVLVLHSKLSLLEILQ